MAVALLTLALGIGVNTAVFSMVNFMLLRPLPVPHGNDLVVLGQQPENSTFTSSFSYRDFLDYQDQSGGFAELAGYHLTFVGLSADRQAERVVATYVTGNYFTMLGLNPEVGRLILPSEGQSPGADPVIVLSYAYWTRRFNGERSIVGAHVLVNGQPVTVVGVAPQSFHGVYALVDSDAYLPFSLAVTQKDSAQIWDKRGERALSVVGRLKPGASLERTQSSLNVVADRLAQQYPATNKGISIRVFPERLARPEPDPSGSLSVVATLFVTLAALVLLIACVNVTNILLVRASGRQQEMAIRTAVGATRGRLVRQLLTEYLLLSFLGGIAGAVIGAVASRLLSSIRLHIDIPVRLDFSFDWRVFAYCFSAALVAGVIVGVLPALWASRTDRNAAMQDGSHTVSPSRGRQRFRSGLVVAQVACSMVLLIVGGLFIRSLEKAQHMYLGFDPDHVLDLTLDVREAGYDEARGKQFYRELKTRAGALPGVQSASLAFSVPFGYYRQSSKVYIEGRVPGPGEQSPEFAYNVVDPAYFATLRISLVRGRAFTDADNDSTPRVAMINETMAKTFWPGQDPIDRRFRIDDPSGPPVRVIGVTQDGKYVSPIEDVHPYFFVPLAQQYMPVRTLQIRTAAAPEDLTRSVLQQVRDLEPNLPVFEIQTMPRALAGVNGFFLFQFGAGLAAAMGGLGLFLAMIGIYGVASYTATQRRREMGIRLAFGAQRTDLLNIILKQGLLLSSAGVLIGLVMAFIVTNLMSSLLVGISFFDPLTFAFFALLTIAVGSAACYLPARRAMQVDPVQLLRYQ